MTGIIYIIIFIARSPLQGYWFDSLGGIEHTAPSQATTVVVDMFGNRTEYRFLLQRNVMASMPEYWVWPDYFLAGELFKRSFVLVNDGDAVSISIESVPDFLGITSSGMADNWIRASYLNQMQGGSMISIDK